MLRCLGFLRYAVVCFLLAACGSKEDGDKSRCYKVFVTEIHTCVPNRVECRRILCRVRTNDNYLIPICDPSLGQYLGRDCD